MRQVKDPRQTALFDTFKSILSPCALRTLDEGWQGVFRHVILELMPVDAIGQRFHPVLGAPSKELYSMCGLILIMEFKDWTQGEAAQAYMFNADVQYALNLEPAHQTMCARTIQRYQKLLVEDDLAGSIMAAVTTRLVELLEIDTSRQRLDSTHVLADMALFGRTRLMGVTIKRFLTQVKRHDRDAYEALPQAVRERYTPSKAGLFANVAKDGESRRRLRLDVARDMHWLIERFDCEESMTARQTYKDLLRVFCEQCETVQVQGKTAVEVKKHPGNETMQNPSDPDATRDGCKGAGYQAQIAQTCGEGNETQIVTSVVPQIASEQDAHATGPVLEQLDEQGLLPELLLADTHYGGDESVVRAREKGVDVQAPVGGIKTQRAPDALSIDDFVVDEATETVERCPAGHRPVCSEHDAHSGRTRTEMPVEACGNCSHVAACPVRRAHGRYVVTHTAKARRLEARRREQATAAFEENYRIRAGIEGTNSGLKRRTGLGRVRARGRPRVFHKIVMKVCGWNILQAAGTQAIRRFIAEKAVKSALSTAVDAFSAMMDRLSRLWGLCAGLWCPNTAFAADRPSPRAA
jgi:hypothetical protein